MLVWHPLPPEASPPHPRTPQRDDATLTPRHTTTSQAQLVDLLTYHVASGNVQAKDVKDGEMIKTVEGKDVTARVIDGSILINSAKVLLANVDASNGVVHIIDAVLIPPGFVPPTPTTGCTGASEGLAADQCAAWGEFWDDAGGPNWGGKGKDCLKSDPCACGYAVRCSGGSITDM